MQHRGDDISLFAMAGTFLFLLGIPVICAGINQAMRRRTWTTFLEGLVLFAAACLMVVLDHSVASD